MVLATFILTHVGCTLDPYYTLSMDNRGEQTIARKLRMAFTFVHIGGKNQKNANI